MLTSHCSKIFRILMTWLQLDDYYYLTNKAKRNEIMSFSHFFYRE